MPEGRILIVDDDKNQALMLKKLLALEEYDAHVVHSGLAAGEFVATGAQFLLDSESRLRATSATGGGGGHGGHGGH